MDKQKENAYRVARKKFAENPKSTRDMSYTKPRKYYKSDKVWNNSSKRKNWYKTNKVSHMQSNWRWSITHKNQTKLYRVRSYFKKFNGIPNKFQLAKGVIPKPIANVKDLRQEEKWITARLHRLEGYQKRAITIRKKKMNSNAK